MSADSERYDRVPGHLLHHSENVANGLSLLKGLASAKLAERNPIAEARLWAGMVDVLIRAEASLTELKEFAVDQANELDTLKQRRVTRKSRTRQ